MRAIAILLICSIAPAYSADKPRRKLSVRAVTHAAQVNERRGTYTTPGSSDTTCNTTGTATATGMGGMATANGTATTNCQTTSTPAQSHEVVRRTVSVTNVVEAEGMRYKIACTASWDGSNCSEMTDGDVYDAELDGNTMWVEARRGGNQGKLMRVKYKVLDIRPVPEPVPQPAATAAAAVASQAPDPGIQRFLASVAAAKQRHPDFDAVTSQPSLVITPTMKEAILESETAGDLMYWLGQHPDECRRIAALSPTASVLELGKITAALAGQN